MKIQNLFPARLGPNANAVVNNFIPSILTSRVTTIPSVKIDQALGDKGKQPLHAVVRQFYASPLKSKRLICLMNFATLPGASAPATRPMVLARNPNKDKRTAVWAYAQRMAELKPSPDFEEEYNPGCVLLYMAIIGVPPNIPLEEIKGIEDLPTIDQRLVLRCRLMLTMDQRIDCLKAVTNYMLPKLTSTEIKGTLGGFLAPRRSWAGTTRRSARQWKTWPWSWRRKEFCRAMGGADFCLLGRHRRWVRVYLGQIMPSSGNMYLNENSSWVANITRLNLVRRPSQQASRLCNTWADRSFFRFSLWFRKNEPAQSPKREFGLEVELGGRRMAFSVSAAEFSRMGWVLNKLGPQAIIYPGQQQHARAAIQWLSGEIRQEHIFAHLGWRKHGPASGVPACRGCPGCRRDAVRRAGPSAGRFAGVSSAIAERSRGVGASGPREFAVPICGARSDQLPPAGSRLPGSLRQSGLQRVSHRHNGRVQDCFGGAVPAALRSGNGCR